MECAKSIGRVVGGFVAQWLGVFVSVNVFASSNGIFWWTGSAIAIAAMILTPDKSSYERVVHVVSGMAAYIPFRYEKFSAKLLASVCVSNGLGQVFGYVALKRFYPVLAETDVRSIRFLAIFMLFPVVLASLVASIPGSLGFYLYGENVDVVSVIVNYTLGHISGTAALLYPLLIVPTLWKNTSWSKNAYTVGYLSLIVVTGTCSFTNYHLCGFATIISLYGVFLALSAYMDQCQSSLVQLACTCPILGLTAAGRGPFVYVIKAGNTDARELLIGTQMGIAALVTMSAFVAISISQLRVLQDSQYESRVLMEKMAENQTVDLFRIGHDMRNNSTLVQAVCDMEDADMNAGDKVDIVKAINVLNDVLVCDMVEMVSNKKADRLVLREHVDVVEVMQVYFMIAKGLLLMEGKDKSVIVENNFSGEENYVVYTNRERLHQVIANLVSNAVKYTEVGKIVLGVRDTSASNLKIDVADSGIGLNEADVASVFDLFFRSKRASEVNSGAGVGLFNVQKLCDAIDARIEVSSLGEGKGSTFTLVLPKKHRAQVERVARAPSTFSFRVLVMDDSPVIRKLMTRYLVSFGCEVVDLPSAEEARVFLLINSNEEVDVVITDSSMGVGETGPEFIHNIRKGRVKGLSEQVPCIICSGNQFYDEGTDTDPRTIAITKPFSSTDIADAITKLTTSTATEFNA